MNLLIPEGDLLELMDVKSLPYVQFSRANLIIEQQLLYCHEQQATQYQSCIIVFFNLTLSWKWLYAGHPRRIVYTCTSEWIAIVFFMPHAVSGHMADYLSCMNMIKCNLYKFFHLFFHLGHFNVFVFCSVCLPTEKFWVHIGFLVKTVNAYFLCLWLFIWSAWLNAPRAAAWHVKVALHLWNVFRCYNDVKITISQGESKGFLNVVVLPKNLRDIVLTSDSTALKIKVKIAGNWFSFALIIF